MPFHFEFEPVHAILRCRVEGPVTDESLKQYYQELCAHAARLLPRSGITDFSAVTSFEVSSETVRELAHLAPALPDPSRPRVAVAPSGLVFGLVRMFQTVGGETRPKLHVVRTLEEAYAFLDVQAPRFEPLPGAPPDAPAR